MRGSGRRICVAGLARALEQMAVQPGAQYRSYFGSGFRRLADQLRRPTPRLVGGVMLVPARNTSRGANKRRARPQKSKRSATVCFFFQAEDGIRDGRMTVQTCALPI